MAEQQSGRPDRVQQGREAVARMRANDIAAKTEAVKTEAQSSRN